MKKLLTSIFLMSAIITSVNAYDIMGQIMSKAVEKGVEMYKERETVSSSKNQPVNINNLLVKKYINEQNCDRILTNDGYFVNCYDYNLKGTIYSYSKLDGNKVNSGNIDERPKFYTDLNLPKQYQTNTNDYKGTGLDRGHINLYIV